MFGVFLAIATLVTDQIAAGFLHYFRPETQTLSATLLLMGKLGLTLLIGAPLVAALYWATRKWIIS